MIKKVEDGYQVLSRTGKNLGGPYKTLEEAHKRLRQVEFFKHRSQASQIAREAYGTNWRKNSGF